MNRKNKTKGERVAKEKESVHAKRARNKRERGRQRGSVGSRRRRSRKN